MKRISSVVVAFTAIFALAGHVRAAPMYYTFDGTISAVTDDAGIIADAGLALGSAVTYTLLVDFAADGTITYNGGRQESYSDIWSNDYFFTDYVSGDAIWQKDGGYYNSPSWVAEYNYGDATSSSTNLYTNSFDDLLQIYAVGISFSDWAVGTGVIGFNRAYDSTGIKSYLNTGLTLTSITPVTTAVPESSTLLLLGSGLFGLGFGLVRRRRLKG